MLQFRIYVRHIFAAFSHEFDIPVRRRHFTLYYIVDEAGEWRSLGLAKQQLEIILMFVYIVKHLVYTVPGSFLHTGSLLFR